MLKVLVLDNGEFAKVYNHSLLERKYFVSNCDNIFCVFSKLKSKYYDVIVTTTNISEIDCQVYIRLIRELTPRIKIIAMQDTSEEALELELYKQGGIEVLNYGISSDVLKFKFDKVFDELEGRSTNRIIDYKNNIEVELNSRVVYCGDRSIHMSVRELDLLVFLIKNKNKVIPREVIEKNVWGSTTDIIDSRNVDIYILKIRKKLGCKCIESIRGVGYSWISE